MHSRTINPLHFEDLEPHRFEDLARQLVYDFRAWAVLEATGRFGADEGFDVRGRESVSDVSTFDEEENNESADVQERIWLIQCKREKTISPKKIENYLKDIFENLKEDVYGIIFIAPCDFSKKTRDAFILKTREHGIKEFQLLGRAELEDLLFQPKNDHLLFAYFGFSLSIRKRTIKTQIRSLIAIKKKALKCIESSMDRSVLLRDATDTKYPNNSEIKNFDEKPSWRVYEYENQEHNGLIFKVKRYMAYLDDDSRHFDFIDHNENNLFDDPWPVQQCRFDLKEARKQWNELPDKNKTYLEIFGIILYDDIIAIDEDGDNHFQGPHFYISFPPDRYPFTYYFAKLFNMVRGDDQIEIYPNRDDQIAFFPDMFRSRIKAEA